MMFEDFWLDLIPTPGGVRVSVRETPSGEVPSFNAILPPVADITHLAAAFDEVGGKRDFHLAATPPKSLERRIEETGEQLGEALFSPELREIWGACHGTGVRRERPVRLRLQMSIDEPGGWRLHALPWECLRIPGAGFAAVDDSVSLVRYVRLRGRDRAPARPRPLRVLVVASQAPGLRRLELDGEIDALLGLANDDLQFDVLRDPSLERLEARLGDTPVHALHFLGHGGFDDRERRGVLFLRRGEGDLEAVPGELLASALQRARSLRLVVLNACHTARAAEQAPFAGVATALIRGAGVPAVVAMQFPIPDRVARRFAQEFYERLAAGDGLERAVAEGRRQLRLTGTPAWMVPVLFSRLRGELFAEPERTAGRVRGRRRSWLRAVAATTLAALLGLGGLSAWWVLRSSAGDAELNGGKTESTLGRDAVAEEPEEPEVPHHEPEPDSGQNPPVSNRPADGAKSLTCGEAVHFAQTDAYVDCVRQVVGGESFLTLTLNLGGGSYDNRAVVGPAGEVRFAGPPDVVVPVSGVDLEAGHLTVHPPRPR